MAPKVVVFTLDVNEFAALNIYNRNFKSEQPKDQDLTFIFSHIHAILTSKLWKPMALAHVTKYN